MNDFSERFRAARAAFAASKQAHDELTTQWQDALRRLNTMRKDGARTNDVNDAQDDVAALSRRCDEAKFTLDTNQRRLRVLDREALDILRREAIVDYARSVAEVRTRLADLYHILVRLGLPEEVLVWRTCLPSATGMTEYEPGSVLGALMVINDPAVFERVEARLTALETTSGQPADLHLT